MIVLGEQDERVEKYTSGGIVLRMKGVHRAPPGMSMGCQKVSMNLVGYCQFFILDLYSETKTPGPSWYN